jgi:hypothetical protein
MSSTYLPLFRHYFLVSDLILLKRCLLAFLLALFHNHTTAGRMWITFFPFAFPCLSSALRDEGQARCQSRERSPHLCLVVFDLVARLRPCSHPQRWRKARHHQDTVRAAHRPCPHQNAFRVKASWAILHLQTLFPVRVPVACHLPCDSKGQASCQPTRTLTPSQSGRARNWFSLAPHFPPATLNQYRPTRMLYARRTVWHINAVFPRTCFSDVKFRLGDQKAGYLML